MHLLPILARVDPQPVDPRLADEASLAETAAHVQNDIAYVHGKIENLWDAHGQQLGALHLQNSFGIHT